MQISKINTLYYAISKKPHSLIWPSTVSEESLIIEKLLSSQWWIMFIITFKMSSHCFSSTHDLISLLNVQISWKLLGFVYTKSNPKCKIKYNKNSMISFAPKPIFEISQGALKNDKNVSFFVSLSYEGRGTETQFTWFFTTDEMHKK